MSLIHPRIPLGITLRRILSGASFVGCADIRVQHATHNSLDCSSQAMFAALRGREFDGHHFIRDAIQHGATSVLVEYPQSDVPVPQCVVRNSRQAFARICSALNGDPSRELSIAGVTGTNGKTTTTWLVRSILQTAGIQTGLLGTIEYNDGIRAEPSTLTTPDSMMLTEWLSSMVSHGTTHAAIEMSSHALDQCRCAGTLIDAAVMTNITHDHLDYHLDYDAYRASKLHIFESLKPGGVAILNADDPGSISCLAYAPGQVITFGIHNSADVSATILQQSSRGTTFVLTAGVERIEVRTSMIGEHNVSNCLAAAAAMLHAGIALPDIAAGIEALTDVPGRLERIDCGQPFNIFVDYAHTDDALQRAIAAAKTLTAGRLFCVFGAGGDRDRSKRPLLGCAGASADVAVVTSDNPRSESPSQIIDEIVAGMPVAAQPHIEADRAEAIRWALSQAGPQDTVLVAGKGHESEQIIGSQRLHFDDREVIGRIVTAGLKGPHDIPATNLIGPHKNIGQIA
ncbi:UDP-N-acetylmuramoyl-L-alanyl-D-glutamate--2,6-diaminopimelate ligase MurE [Symmachiella dynata]|uniref:UDP-N-acetylmuramoyl-L-alanyl-D-glutamate--2, 6-diaminopimelate ligase n=1 Tax=Symmachiella dynata TaxID=2527995 RepID=UPI00118C1D21|nr:UDP-N-acetylmuramoyl-L-alanyl-D-glutamate--2,6-diaminopimelate ligase [Symmachiella dynata]QDT51239.1 UDP-N-acetylmuramoyl-L-alanyl-D-glutamate--2,6-diaminopimelate ligase MurE [Symmachiella dynata]